LIALGVPTAIAVASFVAFPPLLDEMAGVKPSETRPPPGVGKTLAEFALEPLTGDGKPVTLHDLAGKVVVVNFWGTWCPPCRMEFPHLVDLFNEFRERPDFGLFLVSCAFDRDEQVGQLREDTWGFLQDLKYDVPTYWDPKFKTRRAFHRVARLQGYPTTFILDRSGVIRGIWTGFNPSVVPEIRQLVVRLLDEEKTPATPGKGVPEAP